MTAPAPYVTPWNDSFNFGLDGTLFANQVRLHQAWALRRWSQAPAEVWRQESAEFLRDQNHWAKPLPAPVVQAWLQDTLARSLAHAGGVSAVPVLLTVGAMLTDPHPDGQPSHHPMHCALQPTPDRPVLLRTVLAQLPTKPFADGADPFPGWPREQALRSLYIGQFSQAAHALAQGLELRPTPDEQAVLMADWLTTQQRKRCTIAHEQWGWTPTPSPALMDAWWTTRTPDTNHPDRVSAFDLAWGERYQATLPFFPAEREMSDTPVCAARRLFAGQVGQELARWAVAMQRSAQWMTVCPLDEAAGERLSAQIVRMNANLAELPGRAPAPANEALRQAEEAAVLRHEMAVQTYQDAVRAGGPVDPLRRTQPRL